MGERSDYDEARLHFLRIQLDAPKSSSLERLLAAIDELLERSHKLSLQLARHQAPKGQVDEVAPPSVAEALREALLQVTDADLKIAALRLEIADKSATKGSGAARVTPHAHDPEEATVAQRNAREKIATLRAELARGQALAVDALKESIELQMALRVNAIHRVESALALLAVGKSTRELGGLWPTFLGDLLTIVYEHHSADLNKQLNEERFEQLRAHGVGLLLDHIPVVSKILSGVFLLFELSKAKAKAFKTADGLLVYLERYQEVLAAWCESAEAAIAGRT